MQNGLKRTLALAALLTGFAGSAHAMEGWYGGVAAGVSTEDQLSIDDTSDYDLDESHPLFASVGYAYGNGFRAEIEGGFRTGSSNILLDAVDADVLSAMVNVYYDFNRDGRIQPYLGVGVGAARVDAEGSFFLTSLEIDDVALAYQGMAGVGFELSDRLMLDIGYRYFETDDVDGTSVFLITPSPIEGKYTQEAVTIGLRASLGEPAAPPPPPPPPAPPPPPPPPAPVAAACPTGEFVVYFEWDRSALNQAALETIDAAVARVAQCNLGGIVVVGHTDTSGSPQYNIGLSQRRASVVRDALVARGVAAGAITTEAHGETDLARATRDGVREPLNRRTAVTISFR